MGMGGGHGPLGCGGMVGEPTDPPQWPARPAPTNSPPVSRLDRPSTGRPEQQRRRPQTPSTATLPSSCTAHKSCEGWVAAEWAVRPQGAGTVRVKQASGVTVTAARAIGCGSSADFDRSGVAAASYGGKYRTSKLPAVPMFRPTPRTAASATPSGGTSQPL